MEEQETWGCVIYSDQVEPVQCSTHDSSGVGYARATLSCPCSLEASQRTAKRKRVPVVGAYAQEGDEIHHGPEHVGHDGQTEDTPALLVHAAIAADIRAARRRSHHNNSTRVREPKPFLPQESVHNHFGGGCEWQQREAAERTLRTDTTASEHRTGARGEQKEKIEVGDDR